MLHIRLLSLKAVLLCLSAHHCFLLLRAIRRYECTTICSPILLLIDIWIISSFGLLYEGSCSEHSISSVSTFCGQQPPCPQERNSWVTHRVAMFNFIRKCHMIFQLVLFLICHFINVNCSTQVLPTGKCHKISNNFLSFGFLVASSSNSISTKEKLINAYVLCSSGLACTSLLGVEC